MGGLREWAQQAAGQPPANYEPHVFYPWATITTNIAADGGDPTKASTSYADYRDFYGLDTDGTFNMATELYALRDENGENPFAGVEPYDPARALRKVDDALEALSREVDRGSRDDVVTDATRLARKRADDILGDDLIDDAIAAERARMRLDYLDSKSNLLTELWLAGHIGSTQAAGDLAVLEDGFNRNADAMATKMRLAREDKRAEIAMRFVELQVTRSGQTVSLKQVYVAVALDVLKTAMTAGQDYIDKGLEYAQHRKFWNIGLLQLALNANSAIYGAQIVPRAQTKGERLVGAIAGSASMGIQAGMAMGSPGAGLAFGGLNFLSQMLLQ